MGKSYSFGLRVYQFLCVLSFPVGFGGGMWDLTVLIPDHCFSIYLFVVWHTLRRTGIMHLFSYKTFLNGLKGLDRVVRRL